MTRGIKHASYPSVSLYVIAPLLPAPELFTVIAEEFPAAGGQPSSVFEPQDKPEDLHVLGHMEVAEVGLKQGGHVFKLYAHAVLEVFLKNVDLVLGSNASLVKVKLQRFNTTQLTIK